MLNAETTKSCGRLYTSVELACMMYRATGMRQVIAVLNWGTSLNQSDSEAYATQKNVCCVPTVVFIHAK